MFIKITALFNAYLMNQQFHLECSFFTCYLIENFLAVLCLAESSTTKVFSKIQFLVWTDDLVKFGHLHANIYQKGKWNF